MADEIEVAWVRLAVVAGGVVAVAVVARGVATLLGIVFGELRYHAGDPDNWTKWLR